MPSINDFLKAKDLDDLLKVRREIKALTDEDRQKISDVLHDWQDGQSVSNLLFYPSLIPDTIRYECIDRALGSVEQPYFVLASVVGLQSLNPDEVPAEFRKKVVVKLLELIRSDISVISSRASVTIRHWLREGEIDEYLRAYPVAEETVRDNIVRFSLSHFGKLTRKEYCERLRSCGLGFWTRFRFIRRFKAFQRHQSGLAFFMTTPLLSYIPNYESMARD
jgi:hypothetical protein